MARIADQTERYEDMVQFLKKIIQEISEDVSVDVKNLLSIYLKNLISSQRSAWKTIQRSKEYAFLVLESCKSTIFELIPLFNGEIGPLIFAISLS